MRSTVPGFLVNGDIFKASLRTIIKSLTIHNTSATPQEVTYGIQKDGENFDLAHVELLENEIATSDDEYILKKGMSLYSTVTTPNIVSFILTVDVY